MNNKPTTNPQLSTPVAPYSTGSFQKYQKRITSDDPLSALLYNKRAHKFLITDFGIHEFLQKVTRYPQHLHSKKWQAFYQDFSNSDIAIEHILSTFLRVIIGAVVEIKIHC